MANLSFNRSLVWVRRDLRVTDHVALARACAESQEVVVVFVFDDVILKHLDSEDRRLTFIHQSLVEVDEQLQKKGSRLVVLKGDPTDEIPKLVQKLKVDAVYSNRDYEPYAQNRDHKVCEALKKSGVEFFDFKDQVVFEKDELLNGSGEPYKVYTPYKKLWLKTLTPEAIQDHRPQLKKVLSSDQLQNCGLKDWSLKNLGFTKQEVVVQGGEKSAHKLFKNFLEIIRDYKKNRDRPDLNATSYLSVHLRFGTISIRELVRQVHGLSSVGAECWLSELIWREFYSMILFHFPHVTKKPFQEKYSELKWPGKVSHFKKWCEGQTGYPIIDAAMRHFNQTGWMHNRLRMIVASFLTKDLLVDWKKGERYFAKHLFDYDLASNNGGWHWSASTGTDAQPYFRIFNPTSQSTKFDPDGDFIRQHVPELKSFSNKFIHEPAKAPPLEQAEAGCVIGKDYPEPIVDHSVQRQLALGLFKVE